MNQTTLMRWKKKTCDDKSASWLEADVKPLGWTYVVDQDYDTQEFGAFLFVTDFSDETKISKNDFKTREAAQQFCEKHLQNIHKKLEKFMK